MNVRCDGCATVYRVDPAKVPQGGVRARCERCDDIIQVGNAGSPGAATPFTGPTQVAEPEWIEDSTSGGPSSEESRASNQGGEPSVPFASPGETTDSSGTVPQPVAESTGIAEFGRDDPHTRARRLATALISDIRAYHPERWREGLDRGTLREDMRDEIRKSWEEYTLQVGDAVALSTSYFRDALNQILGEGRRMF